ncbi:MAG: SpoIIE family protein phosphatase [Planctomycetota bacterium]|nr:SpoIIE family protein phosphatase [Planctomycetota bacterium]
MRIRWKLMILLLVIALVPSLTTGLIGRISGQTMSRELVDDISRTLVTIAYSQLEDIVDRAVAMLERDRTIISTAVDIQAKSAERLLAGDPVVSGRAYLDSEFDDPATPPPGLVESPAHSRYDETGVLKSMHVSYDVPVIRLSPGIRPEQAAGDLARLASMIDSYRFVHDRHPNLILWQYTAMNSGVQSAYPGHGGYPEAYDGRERVWYKNVIDTGIPQWMTPIIDASTGKLMLTRAAPIFKPDGSLVGVTAIDISMTQIIKILDIPEDWLKGAKAALSLLLPNSETGEIELTVVAQQAYTHTERDWETEVELEVLRSSDQKSFDEMIADIANGVTSVRRMPYQGEDCLWGCGPLVPPDQPNQMKSGASLVIIVPFRDILAEVALSETKVRQRLERQFQFTGVLLTLVIGVVILIAFLVSRQVTLPIQRLAQAASRIAEGDLEARAEITRADEFGELGESFNAMVPHLQDRLKLKESLALAKEVQQHLLPGKPPDIKGLDIAGRSVYCDETGGDYYDFIHFDSFGPRRVGVAIGDVTGHGIAAALLMTAARAVLKIRAHQGGDVSEVLGDMNRQIAQDTPAGKFMTFFYLELDTAQFTGRWVSAGHDPAIVYDPTSDSFDELEGRDVPLGVDETWEYHEESRSGFDEGQVILLGTDGIWEARNEQDEMFSKERMKDVVRAKASESADVIADAVIDAVRVFRGARDQADDITLIVVKFVEDRD